MEGDPCKFILTSRAANASVESFVLHSSHPGVREVWTLQISQILESQRNFLNGGHAHNPVLKVLLEGSLCIMGILLFITALISPLEYQRNHMDGSSGSRVPSTAASAGGSSVPAVPPGVGVGNPQGGAVPSGSQGGSRRPSRIPQPSRLPQPLRHHPGADPEGPSKMAGMKLSVRLEFELNVLQN